MKVVVALLYSVRCIATFNGRRMTDTALVRAEHMQAAAVVACDAAQERGAVVKALRVVWLCEPEEAGLIYEPVQLPIWYAVVGGKVQDKGRHGIPGLDHALEMPSLEDE